MSCAVSASIKIEVDPTHQLRGNGNGTRLEYNGLCGPWNARDQPCLKLMKCISKYILRYPYLGSEGAYMWSPSQCNLSNKKNCSDSDVILEAKFFQDGNYLFRKHHHLYVQFGQSCCGVTNTLFLPLTFIFWNSVIAEKKKFQGADWSHVMLPRKMRFVLSE